LSPPAMERFSGNVPVGMALCAVMFRLECRLGCND